MTSLRLIVFCCSIWAIIHAQCPAQSVFPNPVKPAVAGIAGGGTDPKSTVPAIDQRDIPGKKRSGSNSDLRQLEKLINDLAIEHMPHKYEKKKDWGEQAERWDGLHIRLKDFQLKTKRRKRLVNHGTWKMYSAELAEPRNGLKFKLNSIRKNAKGNAVVNLSVTAQLKLFGRISEWVKGVQLYSISADGTTNVTLHLVTTIGTRLDFSNLPPDVCLSPVVNNATLTVHDFRIKRVSKLGGEFAQQVGRGVRKILDDKIKEYETKLVQKLNKSISKKKDSFRLSASELVKSEWSKLAEFINDQ